MAPDSGWESSPHTTTPQPPNFSSGLARGIWIVGALLVVAAGVGGYVILKGSSDSSSGTVAVGEPSAPAPGSTPELAAQYSALADASNRRDAPFKAELNQLLSKGNLTTTNAAAMRDALRNSTAETRDFDAKLAQMAFPPAIAADAQAVIAADAQINASADKIINGGCTDVCTAWAQAAPYFELRTKAIEKLRADLGLPPST
jgi:hypothetical protein